MHLDRVVPLLKEYPRRPVRLAASRSHTALASFVSLIGTIQWGRSDHPFNGASLDYMTDPNISAYRFGAVIEQIESGAIPRNQIYNVFYKDLVADVNGTIADIYRYFGFELTEEGRKAMDHYMIENPRDSRPPHRFNFGSEDVVARARKALQPYQDYFNIPNE